MTMLVAAEAPPLVAGAAGALHVGKTRVTLDTVVGAFQDGATAEEITEQYSTLSLGQVHAVIQARERQAETVRQANERLFNPAGVRARLSARQAEQGSS